MFSTRNGPETVFVEMKAPGKKPNASQLKRHEELRALGITVLVIDSLEAIEDLIFWRR